MKYQETREALNFVLKEMATERQKQQLRRDQLAEELAAVDAKIAELDKRAAAINEDLGNS